VHDEREEELSQLRLERDVARLQEELTRIAQRDQVLHHEVEQLRNGLAEVSREEQASRDAVAAGKASRASARHACGPCREICCRPGSAPRPCRRK